jgi:hypothetical protein
MTRSMTRWAVAGCMALAALGAVAVLDVGSATAVAAPSVSQFAGTYVWDRYSPPITITISDSGRIRASDIDGRVLADGGYSFTWVRLVYIDGDPYEPSRLHKVRIQYFGKMAFDVDGNIVGTAGDDSPGNDSFVWFRK